MNESLKKAITMGLRSGDFRLAFRDSGGEKACGTWNNALRQYNAAVAAAGSAAEAQPHQPKTPAKRQAAAASTAGSAVGASTGATTATRTGTLQAPNVRATSQQMVKLQAGKAAFWKEYKDAHKAATLEYAEARRAGTLRQPGSRPVDIAERFDNVLSPDNPERITVGALISWFAKKKAAGISPQQPGPKQEAAKLALVNVVGTFAQMSQLEGHTPKPRELTTKVAAAIAGTAFERYLNAKWKKAAFLSHVRKSTALESVVGESVDKRRVDSLTEDQYAEWFEGFKRFLIDRQFAVWREHPSGEQMLYVSKQKRAYLLSIDEKGLMMNTELEKGRPRAILYNDPKLGAPQRSTVANGRHTTAVYGVNESSRIEGSQLSPLHPYLAPLVTPATPATPPPLSPFTPRDPWDPS